MTTTIQPGLGAGVLFTQVGTGTSPGYSAVDDRRTHSTSGVQEGVLEAGAYMVTERAAGANMSVDIAANAGFARVQGDSIAFQAHYVVAPHSTAINETITAADATHPRVDPASLGG